jgi:tRNA modification GTPase
MFSERPYCACATPPGIGGIAVIRMSGMQSVQVADRVFSIIRTVSGTVRTVAAMDGYTSAFGHVKDPVSGKIIDEAVLTVFRSPHSYTGDDLIEISCHGGSAVRQEILRVLIENGARAAEPGEFTRNAFMAGKIDLTQAESVMDVISAESSLALESAGIQLLGALKQEIRFISESLYRAFAALEMIVEFPEHDDSPENTRTAADEIKHQIERLESLATTYSQGKILSEKMTVVLCGIPNSGKSSLLNRLAGYDRAIVTAIPGTTRDTLEVITSIEGIPVRLIDTAGLRETMDEIEKIGVSRAFDAVREADLLLWLISPEEDTASEDISFLDAAAKSLGDQKIGILVSKSDLISEKTATEFLDVVLAKIDEADLSGKIRFHMSFSSETGEGIRTIGLQIKSIYDELGQGRDSELLITNARHYAHVLNATSRLKQAENVLLSGEPSEIACSLIRMAMDELGEITGDCVSETLVETIFSRFCIGK